MRVRIARVLLFLAVIFVPPEVYGAKEWRPGPVPSGGDITVPAEGAAYLAGQQVEFTCTRGTDYDEWRPYPLPEEWSWTQEADEMAPLSREPRWSLAGEVPGNLLNDIYRGTSVLYEAPYWSELGEFDEWRKAGYCRGCTVVIYDDDKWTGSGVGGVTSPDIGNRNDTTGGDGDCDFNQHQHNIYTVAPIPYDISFLDASGDNEYDISGISDPVWQNGFCLTAKNEPACYKKNTAIKIQVRFWAPKDLATGATLTVWPSPTNGTGWPSFPNTSSQQTWQSWPSGAITYTSTTNLPITIGTSTGTMRWRYKPTTLPVNYIQTTSSAHTVYRIYGSPKCSSSDFTKANLVDSVNYASGCGSESTIASTVNNSVSGTVYDNCICSDSFQKVFDLTFAGRASWYSGQNRGISCCRALGFSYVLQVLGIGPYSQAYVNEMAEPNSAKTCPSNTCPTCGAVERKFSYGGIWNPWMGAVRSGGSGTTCYAPTGSDTAGDIRDEGTYSQIRDDIAADCGFYWVTATGSICTHLAPP